MKSPHLRDSPYAQHTSREQVCAEIRPSTDNGYCNMPTYIPDARYQVAVLPDVRACGHPVTVGGGATGDRRGTAGGLGGGDHCRGTTGGARGGPSGDCSYNNIFV